jgi:hypothetical protein
VGTGLAAARGVSHLAALLLSFAIATTAVAADGERKAFALPDNSKLELSIPAGWKDEVKAQQGSTPVTIALTPRDGAGFQVVITPVGRQRAGTSADTAIKMRENVQEAADKVKPGVVETILTAEALTGAPGPGYSFSATDREPKPGEFKYLTYGMLLVGDVIVAFNILTHEGQDKAKEEALAMLKSASHAAR